MGRPFALEEAPSHFAKLKNWGFNEIRYIFTWEAIEHEAPGKYDEEWVDFTIEVLRIAKQYGFLVHMDSHQDAVGEASFLASPFTLYKTIGRRLNLLLDT